ncbi:hypothetical protein METBIDRAFT_46634 [Metschnikowia bicuspidata var. bicuspidata NRRL YB-4993]|uniref:CTLH/CRA C-terminal to LisH motif domain-containing protein n=1 Tax=Metschnikowia bicuspidata var. bicuspidata NRRL YB-4993 TaxID=869754 RepID=A0A1A0H5Y3_9ASCO|nr:hypothetical protein METBIDRAFT_46634 [Metschnikowia bicuspidata var. bicuspidata NRRL YB-4993]OBA19365.1 hypothetical protein METBIDRAFT_46634 [Metschnikowia bicuspidata var. bicuspidata NRRL YB-4993]
MSSSEFTYVIPPYLLNSCVGQELHQELCWLDPDLAARNYFSPESSHYRFRLPRDLSQDPNSFCDDTYINELIRKKLREKFAALGILGSSCPDEVKDEYLFELYEIFKDRLMPNKEGVKSPEEALRSGDRAQDSYNTTQESLFDLPRYGEFIYKKGYKGTNSHCLEASPLEILISWARDKKENKYSFFPYLMVDDKNFFLSPLPMYWTPLSGGNHLKVLDEQFNLESDIENGYSVLRLKLSRDNAELAENQSGKKRFYNFISNNQVQENTGVYYYEVSIEQMAAKSTDYDPIIQANDPSLSSGSSLFFNMGFTKRTIKFDKIPSSTGPLSATTLTIDLKKIQADICLHSLSLCGSKLDEDTITFLGAEPGVSFEGSLAISFNNSCSYASIKRNDGDFRTSSLNLNRRFSQLNRHNPADQELTKLDIDVPFHTFSLFETEDKKCFQTDTVGFGVNFIDRTLFITLNGVIVKTIIELDITASNRYQDSLFGQGAELGPLYPMIGFRLANFSKLAPNGNMPESKIITNFGLKSFQFNINGYIQKLKLGQKKLLQSVIYDELNTVSESSDTDIQKFELSVRNIQDDPAIMNDFIGGYLIQEGFLEAFESFKSDLDDLLRNVSQVEDEEMREAYKSHSLNKIFAPTKAVQRQQLKQKIIGRQFSEAIDILQTEFSHLRKLELFVFELELLQYIELLRCFYNVKFESDDEDICTSKDLETSLFARAFTLGRNLFEKSGETSARALKELSSVLLLNDKENLKELSQACRLFERNANDIKVLASMINSEILEEQGFSRESRLENMVTYVEENVSRLSSENKNPFSLVNFERDYMDL